MRERIQVWKQAVAHADVLAHDGERPVAVRPRRPRARDPLGAVRTQNGRERAELHPADVAVLAGIARVPAAVGVEIGNTVCARRNERFHLLSERGLVRADVPRPLDGIAVGSAVMDAVLPAAVVQPVGDVVDVAHDHGTAVHLLVSCLLLIEVLRDLRKEI